MSQVDKRDVEAIREWLAKEIYLPKDFDELVLKKFLYSCHCSLERTKKCIEEFCTRRTEMPEIYANRDPMSKRMQDVYSYSTVTTYMAGKDEILIYQLTDVPSYFDFYDVLKAFTMQADNWINLKRDVLPENHIIIMDIKQYTLSMLPKVNILYYQKFLSALLETMPIRLKEVHLINCPSYYEYLFNLVKPAFPERIIKMINFHPGHLGLHQFIDKKYLPKDFDGECESLAEQNLIWVKDICGKRKSFMNDDYWKADPAIKSKKGGVDTSMNGSFRTLSFD